ncbi:hypothetical protein OC861_006926 [Tilletia horrida]|nr:hypothetical protein OC861_006926 [Tilletia horrida]
MTNKQFTTIALGSGFEAEARDIIDFASDEDQDVRGTGPLGPATEIRLIRLIRTEVERFETSLEPSKLQRLIQALVPEMTIRILSHFGVADAAGALVDVHAIHYGRLVSPLQTDVDSVVARDDGRLRDSIRDEQDEQTAHASAVEQLKQEQQEHASAVEQLSKEQQEHASAVEQLRTEQQEHVSAVERLQNVLLEVRQQNVGLQEAASAAQSDKNAIEDVLKKEYELLANALAGWKVTLEYCNRMMEDNDSYIEAGGRQIPLFDPYAHDEDRDETREKLSRTGRVFKAHSNLNSRVVAIKLYPLLKDSTRAAGGDWRMPERMRREVVALRRISESVKFADFVDLIQVSQRIGAANKLQGGVVMPLYPADLDAIIY